MSFRTNLRIGLDGRPLTQRRSGIGRYVFELSKVLHEELPDAEFFAFGRSEMTSPVQSSRWHCLQEKSRLFSRLPGLFWIRWRVPQLMRQFHLDVFWGSAGILPARAYTSSTLLTIHDFNVIVAPKTMPMVNWAASRLFQRKDILSADAIATNSLGTATRLGQYYGKTAAAVIRPALSDQFLAWPREPDWSLLEKYELTAGRYWLMVSNLEPRKNIETAVQAFLAMKRAGEIDGVKLAICSASGWKNRGLIRLLNDSRALGVTQLSYVPDEHLYTLLRGAKLFLFPSIYEGYGMPVLEALACETPVVTTDLPELREASFGLANYVSPTIQGVILGVRAAMERPRPTLRGVPEVPTWKNSGRLLAGVISDMARKRSDA